MSTLEQPFFSGVSFTIMIGDLEVTLSPHQQFMNLVFNHVDLSHLNLFSCTFEKCNFVDCKMLDIDWSGTSFTNCTFDNCDMTSSVMYQTTLERCTFTKCDLTETRTYMSNFNDVRFSSCDLDATRVIDTEFMSSVLDDCTINGGDWRTCLIAFSTLRNVRATDEPPRLSFVGVTNTNLVEVVLYGADWNDCVFANATIIKCNFWKSNFHDPHLQDCTVSHTGLNETTINEGLFLKSPLFGCRLRLARLVACIFEESDIAACTLAGADLSSTILYESAFIANRTTEGGAHPTVLP